MPWRVGERPDELDRRGTISLTESSSNWARGNRAKARYSSVSASRATTCSRMAATSPAASCHLRLAPVAHDVAEDLGVQLDRGDGVAHLVRHLEREAAHRRHALGHHQLLLGGLQPRQRLGELGVEPLDLAARAALAVGDVSERERGQPHQPHQDHHRRSTPPSGGAIHARRPVRGSPATRAVRSSPTQRPK